MKKIVAAILVVTLAIPHILLAAPASELPPLAAGDAHPAEVPPTAGQNPEYSPRAEKAYLGTGIGTLLAGGAIIALGSSTANDNEIASDAASKVMYVIGGTLLAASTVLWGLYFREKGREPATTVGVDLENGRYSVVAQFRY